MITINRQTTIDRFSDGKGTIFKVTAKYNPNEEHDPWVAYQNEKTGQEYSCRLEAFLSRFSPISD